MILDLKDDPAAFRAAVRAWLTSAVPSDWPERMLAATPAERVEFQRSWLMRRREVGLGTPTWPIEYGGAALGIEHEIILAEEYARANAPYLNTFMVSMNHIPATMLMWGTEEQKRRYMPGVASGDIWCQGFSEPGSGSDLASLRTRAVRDGDHYVVTGQKIWSSFSMFAKHCILLARTDPDAAKHKGITFFVMDMDAPGVEVRPIQQINGLHEFGELFMEEVRIPVENVIGPENGGWTVCQSTLAAERGVLAFEGAERLRYGLEACLADAVAGQAAWIEDDQLRREFMQLLLEQQANRRLVRKLLAEPHDGAPTMTPAMVKLSTTSFRTAFADFSVQIQGIEGQAYRQAFEEDISEPMFEYLTSLGQLIAGGSNEIMRNLIAERGLGMPR
jgi:alkylation response protein AidB-like acyl-CoA dehydrogenase